MKTTKLFNLLISCPGDIKEELVLIKKAIENFNELYADQGIMIQPRYWAKSAFPQSGGKPQSLLNKQFVIDCDAAVALFWTRFGTPTDEYGSGTEEEIEIMLNAGKQVFLYFSEANPSLKDFDAKQYESVKEFKKKYESRGIFGTYDSVDRFYELFSMHLPKFMIQHLSSIVDANERMPALTLLGISDNGKLSESGEITKFIPNTKELSEYQYQKIQLLFKQIQTITPEKPVYLPGALGDLLSSMRNPVEYDDEKKEIIANAAEAMHISIDDSFFELGGLEKPLGLTGIPFSTPELKGTPEEIKKYNALNSLHIALINYDAWLPFEDAHINRPCIKLAVQNNGTAYAHDVELRLKFYRSELLRHTEFPVLPYDTMQYIYHEFSLADLFGIPGCLNYMSYDKTLNPEPTEPQAPTRGSADLLWGPNYEDKYLEELDDAFYYEIFDEGEYSYLCLKIDVLKHGASAAFPTPVFIHNTVNSIEYTITAKELSTPIVGTIQVNNVAAE